MAWTYNAPVSGDTAYVTTLTNCVTELHTAVDGKSPTAGPGSAQAFTVGALSATTVNTIPISTGAGGVTTNTAVGVSALSSNTTGYQNTADGVKALYSNITGFNNTANGLQALYSNTNGYNNTANGTSALYSNTTGYNNTANGTNAGQSTSAGGANATSSSSVYLGYDTRALADGDTNEIVIGAGAIGNGSNTVTIGNTSITKTVLRGNTVAGQFSISALNTAPASATDVGTLGEIRVTASAIYVCTATNTWVKAALATW